MADDDGVESNARMTGVLGAVLLVALAIEGFTLLGVRQYLTLHVFVGFFVVPVVALKLATTGYRFVHYYRGAPAYRRKGPPHPLLRIIAPLVVVATVAVLGTGIALLIVSSGSSGTVRTAHQASFIVWFAVMTLHVLGHAIETLRLSVAEVRSQPRIPRRGVRVTLIAGTMIVGLALGVASTTGWTDAWRNRPHHRDSAQPGPAAPH
jgi:hypothetical protein